MFVCSATEIEIEMCGFRQRDVCIFPQFSRS